MALGLREVENENKETNHTGKATTRGHVSHSMHARLEPSPSYPAAGKDSGLVKGASRQGRPGNLVGTV
jgi:hypothetical protein